MAIQNYRGDLELPELPNTPDKPNTSSTNLIRPQQFTRKNLKLILHVITGELKKRGTKTPHIFLPYRSKVDDTKLELFLRRIFPNGELIPLQSKQDERFVKQILESFDEFTLICSLKYLWSRLPNNEIIGWDVYLEFKRREKEAGYPKSAFLSIMPKCLSSPAHASIVYDFLDLLISLASNSQYNYLSGRKIAKMSSLWAFNGYSRFSRSAFYDATMNNEHNFMEGLEAWKSSSEALFHLLLSFLRAMLPESENDTLKLPKTLQSLLITNSYPPVKNTDSMKSIITIPCVYVRSTKKSANVYELISKVRHTLSFDKKDCFLSIENYTILKNIFRKKSTTEIVDTLTEESRRILSRLTADHIDSEYDIYPGWSKSSKSKDDANIPLFSEITIHDVSLQDYYIWTWLSSLGSDQTHHMKNLFGRSLVVEAGLRGFQKWLIITEETMSADDYIHHFKMQDTGSSPLSYTFGGNDAIPTTPIDNPPLVPTKGRVTSTESYKEAPLPPLPTDDGSNVSTNPPSDILPKYNINTKLDVSQVTGFEEEDDYVYPSQVNAENVNNDYLEYLDQLSERSRTPRSIANSNSSNTRRPPPPPLNILESNLSNSGRSSSDSKNRLNHEIFNSRFEADKPKPGFEHEANFLSPIESPTRFSGLTQYYSPSKDDSDYKEPFDEYETEADRLAKLKLNPSNEPYDNYFVSGADSPDPKYISGSTVGSNMHPPAIPQFETPSQQEPEPKTKETKEEKEERRRRRRERKERKKREEAEQQATEYGFPGAPPPDVLPMANGAPIMQPYANASGEALPPFNYLPEQLPSQSLEPGSPKRSKDKKKEKKKKKKHHHHHHHEGEQYYGEEQYYDQERHSYPMMANDAPQAEFSHQVPDVMVSTANMGEFYPDGRPISAASHVSSSPNKSFVNSNYNYSTVYGSHQHQLQSPPPSANRHSHEAYNGGEVKPQRSSAPEVYQNPSPYHQQYPPQGMPPPGHYSQEHLVPGYAPGPPPNQQPFMTPPMSYGFSTSPQRPGFVPSPQMMPPQQNGYYGQPQHMQYMAMNHDSSPMAANISPTPVKSPNKLTTSDLAVMNMPTMGARNKNNKPNKANLRAALNQGGFGI